MLKSNETGSAQKGCGIGLELEKKWADLTIVGNTKDSVLQ